MGYFFVLGYIDSKSVIGSEKIVDGDESSESNDCPGVDVKIFW